ncbi:hypothetical protein CRG98_019962 [Punica granatum]|uniref:Uncharacterized protein n=1 Tax=Punica granatum TaxID=22663 RepID=A0A2I0JW07_PUNGR|nr:hypothetical protein CRG98_019962 [Punica granatum]
MKSGDPKSLKEYMRIRSPGTRINADAKSGDPKSLKEYMRRVPEVVHADTKSGDPKSLKQYMRTRSPGTRSP